LSRRGERLTRAKSRAGTITGRVYVAANYVAAADAFAPYSGINWVEGRMERQTVLLRRWMCAVIPGVDKGHAAGKDKGHDRWPPWNPCCARLMADTTTSSVPLSYYRGGSTAGGNENNIPMHASMLILCAAALRSRPITMLRPSHPRSSERRKGSPRDRI